MATGTNGPPEKFAVLRHAAACFKTPTNRPQNQVVRHAAVFCGMLQLLVLGHGGARL
jgi:hypothetical protein